MLSLTLYSQNEQFDPLTAPLKWSVEKKHSKSFVLGILFKRYIDLLVSKHLSKKKFITSLCDIHEKL